MRGSDKLRTGQRPVAWFILGGTIGNVDERSFFRSLREVAKPNDLLIVGAETLSADAAASSSVVGKYSIPEVKSFLYPAMQAIWHELNMIGSIEDALGRIETRLVPSPQNEYSTVAGAATVELSLPLDRGRKMVLLTSTRYNADSFYSFARTFKFEHELSVPSDLNPNYKLMVFRFLPD